MITIVQNYESWVAWVNCIAGARLIALERIHLMVVPGLKISLA